MMQDTAKAATGAADMAKPNPLCVRLSERTREALAAAAAAENRTVSNYVETLIVSDLRAKKLLARDEK